MILVDAFIVLLALYVASTFSLVIYTAINRPVTLENFLLTLREVVVVAVESLYWLLILAAWRVVSIPWQLAFEVGTSEGSAVSAFVLFAALFIGLTYIYVDVWAAFFAALLSVVLLIRYLPLDLLALLLALGGISVLVSYALYTQERVETRGRRTRRGVPKR